jgi:hypothetical protein
MSTVRVHRQDANGPYTAIHRIYRKPIDSSFLRTSEEIHRIGNKILYGGNDFFFPMSNPSLHRSPPSLLAKRKVWRPSPHKPSIHGDWKTQVAQVITQVERNVPICVLRGWAYYDPFLRFLYTIGPKNAALLKSLKFSGRVKLHLCEIDCGDGFRQCDDDLILSIRLYIPFIKKFCTGLEKLTLYVERDDVPILNMAFYPEDTPLTEEEAMMPLLEKDVRDISTLKEIAVLRGGYDLVKNNWNLDFVEPAMQWFKERTR